MPLDKFRYKIRELKIIYSPVQLKVFLKISIHDDVFVQNSTANDWGLIAAQEKQVREYECIKESVCPWDQSQPKRPQSGLHKKVP